MSVDVSPIVVVDERAARMGLCALVPLGAPGLVAEVAHRGAVDAWSRLLSDRDSRWGRAAAAIDLRRVAAAGAEVGARFVIPGDAEWPAQLADLDGVVVGGQTGAPFGLWVVGARLDELPVVGARAATTAGLHVAEGLAAGIAAAGFSVISGMAFGIDAAAHRGALEAGGPTIAVLPSGLDRPYPSAHHDLAHSIAARGALISEMPPGTTPTRYTFQARNRIIAALARGTVIGEAATRSGALNTTTWTTAISRPVMAVPGDATHPLSSAPNALIRDHTAQLVTTAHDITQAIPVAGRGNDRAMQLRADIEAARADVDTATATLTRAWQRVADTRRRLDHHLNQH
jgi:DNA processing protein